LIKIAENCYHNMNPCQASLLKMRLKMTPCFDLEQDGVCDKNSAPSVSSISRVLRGGSMTCTDLNGSDGGRSNHSIDGILGRTGENAIFFSWHKRLSFVSLSH
jgi:hypothetical protein